MSNLFSLFGTIGIDNSKANYGIDETVSKAKGADTQINGSFGRIKQSFQNAGQAINEVQSGMAKFGAKIGSVVSSVNEAGQRISSAGTSVQDFSKSMRDWGTSGVTGKMAVGGIASAVGLLSSAIPSAIKRIDTLNNANRNFQNMGVSAQTVTSEMEKLKGAIQGLPTGLDTAVSGVQLLTSSLNGDMTQSVEVFKALNDGILGFGGSADQVQNAVTQLSQSFSNGKIDAETWNSMIDSGLGPTLNALAKTMGKTAGQLKDGLSDGSISVKDFNDALVNLDKNGGGGLVSLSQIAKDGTKGISSSFANAKTAVVRGVAEIIKAVGADNIGSAISSMGTMFEKALGQVASALSTTISFVQANAGWLEPIGRAVGAVVGSLVLLKGTAILVSPVISAFGGSLKLVGGIISAIASPFGLFIGIVGAVGLALYAFFTKTEAGKQAFQTLIDFMSANVFPIFDKIKEVVGLAMNDVVRVLNHGGEMAGQAMQVIGNFIADNWGTISTIIGIAMGIINAVIQQGMQLWQTLIMPVVSTIVTFFQENWNNISTIIATVMATIGAIILAAMFIWQQAIFPALLAIANTVALMFGNIVGVISGILNIIAGVINMFMAIITGDWQGALDGLFQIMDGAWQLISNLVMYYVNLIVGIFQAMWGLVGSAVSAGWNIIVALFSAGWNLVVAGVSGAINAIVSTISGLLSGIGAIIGMIINGWVIIFQTAWSLITAGVSMAWNFIMSIISGVLNGIMSIISSVTSFWVSIFSSVGSTILSVITGAWNGIMSVTSGVFNAVRGVVSSIWNGIVSVISGVVNSVSSTVSGGFNALVGIVSGIFNSVKSAIQGAFQGAVDIVSGIVNTIKGLFNFKLKFPDISIPKIPLPHFSISGSFDPLKGKIPSVGIDWFAKGGLMTQPTMFGMNGMNAMVGGEAGTEAILPLKKDVLSMIADRIMEYAQVDNGKTEVNVTQNITMPAYSTPREMQRQAQLNFERTFKNA